MSSPQISSTLRAREARRENARHSTGPRSEAGKRRVALNALKGCGHLRRLSATLRDLGEKPHEFRHLLADLLASYGPANAAEALLVEDLASLRWNRRRCELALAALLAHNRATCRRGALRGAVERRYHPWQNPACSASGGLRGEANASYRFEALKELLDLLRAKVDAGNFGDDTRGLVRTIYGEQPTGRGGSIAKLVDELANCDKRAPLYAVALQTLTVILLEDDDLLELEEAACKSEADGTFYESPDAWFAPDRPEWRLLLRQQAGIDREIERKTKLLMAMQRERESKEAREAERAMAAGHSARGVRSRAALPELDSPEPDSEADNSDILSELLVEAERAEVTGAGADENRVIPAQQSLQVDENTGPASGIVVKTKLNSEGETEHCKSGSGDQSGP